MRPPRARASGLAALAPLALAVLALGPAASEAASGAAQAGPCGALYTVRTGDTMGAIAARCATSVKALMQANPQISDPARISIGQDLAVPPAADAADKAGAGGAAGPVAAEWARQRDAAAVPLLAAGHYTVAPGDDMARIATRLGVPLRDLLAANQEIDPFALQPGQVLALPDPDTLEAIEAPPEVVTGDEAAAAPATAAAESGAPGRYTVEPGDSLGGIAEKAGVPLAALIAANDGVEPRALRPGQSLVLPDPAPDREAADAAAGDARSDPDAGADAAIGRKAGTETASGTETGTGESGATGRYTVEPGDSLGGIAEKAGVPLAALIAANDGVKPRALRPGQALVLPAVARDRGAADPAAGRARSETDAGADAAIGEKAGTETASGTETGTDESGAPGRYTVEPGDSLGGIAAKAGVPLAALIAANDGVKPRALRPGQALVLPDPAPDREAEDAAGAAGAGQETDTGAGAQAGAPTSGEAAEAISGTGADTGENGAGPPGHYTVDPGDSLARIAAKTGVPLDALIAANERVKPRALRPGQSLVLPGVARGGDADPGESGAEAEAGSGDPAGAETGAGSGDKAGDQTAGQAGAGSDQSAGAANDEPAEAASEDLAGGGTDAPAGAGTAGMAGPERYTVQPGDSLGGIAARTGVRLAELMAVNKGIEPRALRPGHQLVIPGGARVADAPDGTEDGAELASAPGDEASPAGAAAPPVEAVREIEPERMRLEGRIRKGVECPVLKTPDGRTYSLVSQAYGFTPGDYVAIEAEPVEVSFCMQGQTVRVTSMKPRPAPQGG